MSDNESADTDTSAAAASRGISDPKAMRALAHPIRLAILDAMRDEGELTATRAAELLNQTPGNMSWHLQLLARYGFIVEAEGAKGRSRPWKVAPGTKEFTPSESVPGSFDAVEHLVMTLLDRSVEQLQQWWQQRQDFKEEWTDTSFVHEETSFLTPAELADIRDQVDQLQSRYKKRSDPAQRPADALPVHLVAFAHPMLRPTPGN